MALYLGFDLSTQSLTALAIEVSERGRAVVFERSLDFDAELPAYGTRHGVLPNDDPRVATAPPLLWAEALDRMMGLVAQSGLDLRRLRALSGSAQQHGSVWLGSTAAGAIAGLDAALPLTPQLSGIFARPDAPVWMDTSTTPQCAEITAALGGAAKAARLTGSRIFERFTGPQIRKGFVEDPAMYRRTAVIHLVSSWAASLLAGARAPVEPGDGAGTALMDLARRVWAPAALEATAPDLAARLPALRDSETVVGPLAPYWRRRYGLPAARVVAWTGDNPSSLVGTGLVREGDVAISLGTSDTLFGPMDKPRTDPALAGSVFGSPAGAYLGLTCFRNGSLARERVRDAFGLDWAGFSDALARTPPGNGGRLMLPWFEPEITPDVPAERVGARPYGLDERDGPGVVRAVVEAQMLALALHSRWMGVEAREIRATGGAAANREILQVMADVHGAPVRRLAVGNTACLGAALRAWHADLAADGRQVPWREIVAGFAESGEPAIRPRREHRRTYARLARAYQACEEHALGTGKDPAPMLERLRKDLTGR